MRKSFPQKASPMARILRLAYLPGLLILAGCVTASGGIATSNIPLDGRSYEVIQAAETTVSWWSVDAGVIGIPLSDPPVHEAEQRLLDEHNGDALVNLRYWNDRSVFLLLRPRQRFHLKADVVRFTEGQ